MKFEKYAPAILVVLVLIAAFFIAQGMGLFRRTESVDQAQVDMAKVIQLDKENLAKEGGDENGISTALERLSIRTDPDVKEYIKKYSSHESPQVKASAAEAAGSYLSEPGMPAIIQDALKSPVEQVRLGGLRGLSRQGGEENEKLILAYLKKSGLSPSEQFQANLTLLKIATTPERRRESLQRLIALSEKKGAAEKLSDVFLFAPNEPLLTEKAKTFFKEGKSPELGARSIQYLSAYDKPWMQEHVGNATILDNMQYQLVLLDSLTALCPAERAAILEKLNSTTAYPEVKKGVADFACKK